MAFGHAVALRNAQLDQITARAGNAALFRVYDGTRPATGGAATNKLAEFTMGTPFAAASAAGVLTVTLPADVVGLANGTATWFRIVQSDGSTHVTDGSIGSDATISNAAITTGAAVQMTGFSLTAGNA